MARPRVKVTRRQADAVLRQASVEAYLADLAEELAVAVEAELQGHTWDQAASGTKVHSRAAGVVVVEGANAGIYQVRDGLFTKVATAAGLTFKGARQ